MRNHDNFTFIRAFRYKRDYFHSYFFRIVIIEKQEYETDLFKTSVEISEIVQIFYEKSFFSLSEHSDFFIRTNSETLSKRNVLWKIYPPAFQPECPRN